MSPADAGSILQAAGASTNMGTAAGAGPSATIDQSGLSTSYTSGVTGFDVFIASNPTHAGQSGTNIWIGSSASPTGNFDFDLGGSYAIQSFALWNPGSDYFSNMIGFNLLGDDNAAFSSPTTLLSGQSANPNTGPSFAALAEVFAFAPTTASFVRLEITSHNGSASKSFGEAAFELSSVAEPSSFLSSSSAGIGLIGRAWRRSRPRRGPHLLRPSVRTRAGRRPFRAPAS